MAKQFQYENHYEMKQNRLKVLEKADYTCSLCGGEANVVHHKDGSKNNHHPDNLISLCHKCHMKVHSKDTKKARWDTEAIEIAMMQKGIDKGELATKIGVTYACISNLLRKGRTKNSTMKKIAEALDCPVEAFVLPAFAEKIDELKERKEHIHPLKAAIYDRLSKFVNDKAKHKLYHIWLTNSLREKYDVKSYFLIPPEKQEEAIDFINNWNLRS
jgi:DNA-binding Xre family transcriptional regulator